MSRRFFLILLFLFSVPGLSYGAAPIDGQAFIGAGEVLRGHFTEERHLKGFNGPLRSEGHFVVAPGTGLIWAVEKPFATTSIITPSGLLEETDGEKIMKIPASQTPFLAHLYDMLGGALAGNWDTLQKDFTVSRVTRDKGWQVSLLPHDLDNPGMPFSEITVKGTSYVNEVLLQKLDGDTDNITFVRQTVSSEPLNALEVKAFQSVGP